ncbi:hypothetical protein CES85_5357 [Ochrobactrum quorumnocens]|uniref:Uncharacterized protein n=1 Tax=Ochrobactrum quorumnocens TaxID=271865 RepID=A0A248UD71_9HYPH|nr:hypothetical protein CES85_5357 [[Ochrobactrum] quorumnocens]
MDFIPLKRMWIGTIDTERISVLKKRQDSLRREWISKAFINTSLQET